MWEIDTGNQIGNMHGHLKDIWALVKIKDCFLASASADKTIRIWNYDILKCIKIFHGHTDIIKCLCFCEN